ncbi:hypothetical protein AB0I10_18865 [Streptomyces sp. NPDC050636]|uniref:hypothetical protein n=1 Tax=Streptomyces sp. NPDC050636 TaxID=3154510 RepID=UPI00344A1511
MKHSRAGTRRRRATTAGAAALLLGGAVASCGAEQHQGAEKHSQGPKLTFKDALNTSYVRQFKEPDFAGSDLPSDPYYVDLEASRLSPGRDPLMAENVKVTIDLSAVKAVTFGTMKKEQGCKRSGDLITCTPKNIEAGEHALLWLFNMSPRRNAAKGPAGPMNITVTSTNAPTIHHTTQLVIGAPSLTARGEEGLTDVKPGSELKLTPAFGNRGDFGIDDDLSIVVEVMGQATLRKQYGNCLYDKAASPTKAVCKVSGPLPAGAAYETAEPITAVTDKTGRQGVISYTVYRAHDTPTAALLPGSAPRGTGAPLGLRPVDGSDFTPFSTAEMAFGGLRFRTTRTHDAQVNGFTIKGKVGQEIGIEVMDVDGYYEGDTWLTLPEGVSVKGLQEGEASESLYCNYVDKKNPKVLCPAPQTTHPRLRVHIDKRVEGAQGTISVGSDPKDPDPENNTAPIKMEYVD